MKPAQWIALLAAVVLAVGVWAATRASRPRPAPAGDDVVAQAMRDVLPPVDSTEIKSRWQDEVRGVDLEGLDDGQRELFVRAANSGRCTCGCGYTLAGCKASDMTCEESGARLAAIRDSIRGGLLSDAKGLRKRPES